MKRTIAILLAVLALAVCASAAAEKEYRLTGPLAGSPGKGVTLAHEQFESENAWFNFLDQRDEYNALMSAIEALEPAGTDGAKTCYIYCSIKRADGSITYGALGHVPDYGNMRWDLRFDAEDLREAIDSGYTFYLVETDPPAPATGDSANPMPLIALAALAAVGTAIVVSRRKAV